MNMIRRQTLCILKSTSRSVYTYEGTRKPLMAFRTLTCSHSQPQNASTTKQSPDKDDVPEKSDVHISSKPYIPLYHHENPSLFPQLLPGSLPYLVYNISSAFNALVTLIVSQEARDKFISISNLHETDMNETELDDGSLYRSIINTNVLGQSDLGFIKVLSLFDGLTSPLYEGTQFNIKDFMDGAGFALDRFNEVGRAHMKMLTENIKAAGEDGIEYDFIKTANSDMNSTEHDLMNMTTPPYWEGFNETIMGVIAAPKFLLDILKKGNPNETKITHLALLSARVASIEKSISIRKQSDDNDRNKPLEDDSLEPHIAKSDSKPQIVTQLEVLYESEVTLPETDTDGNIRAEGVHTKKVVDVATFESCIAGDPNGELQWRLCHTRPALEFGYTISPMNLGTKP